jgi:hypothetical protein
MIFLLMQSAGYFAEKRLSGKELAGPETQHNLKGDKEKAGFVRQS